MLASLVLELGLVAGHDARNAAEDLGRLQGGRNEVLVALDLAHVDANLERAVDLAVLHEVAPGDAGLFAGSSAHLALLDILGQVEPDGAQCDSLALGGAVLLHNLKLNVAFLQHAALVHRQPDGQRRLVVVGNLVVLDGAAAGAAAVLGGRRVREVPFYKRRARHEGDVVEVEDLAPSGQERTAQHSAWRAASHPQVQVKLWLHNLSARKHGRVSGAVPYASVLGDWNRECVSREYDGAPHSHCSPNACMLKKEGEEEPTQAA